MQKPCHEEQHMLAAQTTLYLILRAFPAHGLHKG